MDENIKNLKKLFKKIKEMKFNKSLRSGSTGIGYTFESLLGKKEDREFYPDFNGIEIKTKLGYTKNPLTLFTLIPLKNGNSCIKYINETFGYTNRKTGLKNFKVQIFHKRIDIIANKYIFKLKIDRKNNKLKLIICNTSFNLIDDQIYWELDELKNRLCTKLNFLAIIKGYPYIKEEKTFYKYTTMSIYKLKDFNTFLNLIEKDKIFITFNVDSFITKDGFVQLNDRGTAFKLYMENIEDLFTRID